MKNGLLVCVWWWSGIRGFRRYVRTLYRIWIELYLLVCCLFQFILCTALEGFHTYYLAMCVRDGIGKVACALLAYDIGWVTSLG